MAGKAGKAGKSGGNGGGKVKMTRYDTLRTPKGIAGFSYLTNPDESFNKADHRLQIFVDKNDPEVKTFVAALLAMKETYLKTLGKKNDKKCPALKKADDYMVERFGEYGIKKDDLYFEFRSKARQDEGGDWIPIEVRGPDAKPSTLRVFGGDIVRASVACMGYNTGKEFGIKPYLNAVQILAKKNGGGGGDKGAVFTDESPEYGTPAAKSTDGEASPFSPEGDAEAAPEATSNDVDLSDLV